MRDPRAMKIAGVALNLAMRDDLPEAANYIKRLSGTNGIIDAILAWLDTYMAYAHPDHKPGQPIRIAWLNVDTDQVEAADEVPPAARWAGRLIAARATDDEAQFYALLAAPAEGAELGAGIMALLQAVAIGLKDTDYCKGRGAS